MDVGNPNYYKVSQSSQDCNPLRLVTQNPHSSLIMEKDHTSSPNEPSRYCSQKTSWKVSYCLNLHCSVIQKLLFIPIYENALHWVRKERACKTDPAEWLWHKPSECPALQWGRGVLTWGMHRTPSSKTVRPGSFLSETRVQLVTCVFVVISERSDKDVHMVFTTPPYHWADNKRVRKDSVSAPPMGTYWGGLVQWCGSNCHPIPRTHGQGWPSR